MAKRIRLEEVLVSRSVLSAAQRDQALRLAKETNCSFADAVVKLGFATEEAMARALSEQLEYPYASRENKLLPAEIDPELKAVVPESFAREHLALPLLLGDKVLTVALGNPENLLTIENLKVLTGYEIQPFVATKTQVLRLIDQLYEGRGADLIAKTIDTSTEEEAGESLTTDVRVDLDRSAVVGQGTQVVQVVNAILKQAAAERASDIHLEAYEDDEVLLRFRIDGVLYKRTPPPRNSFLAVISRLKVIAKLDIAERRLPQDGSFSVRVQNRVIDVRISVCPAAYGEKLVLRFLDKTTVALDMEHLGLEGRQKADFLDGAKQPHGLLLLTGPTGSGKTTTLYSLINSIKSVDNNFMTVEDPIEIRLRGVTQVQVRSDIGLTFAAALRSFLRQDPDVMLVGEIRDLETAETCLRAALTGHLVLSTLHTNDALSAVVRLVDIGVEPSLLASSLTLLAAQRLVRILCPQCRQAYKPSPAQLKACMAELDLGPAFDPAKAVFYRAVGCEKCVGTGYRGRMGIYEVCRVTGELRDLIYRDHRDLRKLKESAARAGMLNLRAAGWCKVLRGMTTPEEILAATMNG
ncbi:MAG TPA: type II secretion system protein GspE [Elusimicrobia bacterium]|nr:type II secretion system protein GspE [Elusimicrobiota bacterium]